MKKIFSKRKPILIFLIFICISICQSCNKDDNSLSQSDLVTVSNEYKNVLEEIATTENLISQLTKKLETATDDEKLIIQAQIDNQNEQLLSLKAKRVVLEKKLGIKTE